MQKKSFLIFFSCLAYCFLGVQAFAQQPLTPNNLAYINKQQDTLAEISSHIYAAKDDIEKLAYNTMFVKRLISVLKTPYSFQHNLEAVFNVSIQRATNQLFKIITWSLPLSDGSYKFYGTIQMATKDGSLKLIPLNDQTAELTDDNQISDAKNWYGARYYEMIPVSFVGKPTYYILLGWKGNNEKTTKKVIEILSFEKDQPVFGKNIFEMPKNGGTKNRIVFEYNKKNSMTLAYDKTVNMVIFDHLAPYEPNMIGNFEYYGSDLSFDGYLINYQKLYLKENIQLKNDPSTSDELYATPRKATTLLPKGKH